MTGDLQSSTKRNSNAYTYTKPVTIRQQVARCSSCAKATGKAVLAADNLSPEAKKPQCKRTSRDRSQARSSKARKALEMGKRIFDQLELDSAVEQVIKDEAESALALAIGEPRNEVNRPAVI